MIDSNYHTGQGLIAVPLYFHYTNALTYKFFLLINPVKIEWSETSPESNIIIMASLVSVIYLRHLIYKLSNKPVPLYYIILFFFTTLLMHHFITHYLSLGFKLSLFLPFTKAVDNSMQFFIG